MMGNYHVRFLGGKGVVTPLTYPVHTNKGTKMDDDLIEQRMIESLRPYIVHNLLKKGKFSGVGLNSPSKLFKVFSDNISEGVDDLEFPIGVSESFIGWAQKALNEGDQFVAIVLVAIAMEQELNNCYRYILREDGLVDDDITKIIKNHNIESKLTWLLKLTAKVELNDNLRKNVKAVFDIRNSVIHYKAVFTKLDQDIGSYERIELELRRIEGIDLFSLFKEFYEKLKEICFQNNEEWVRAVRITQKIESYKSKKEKKST